MNILQLVLCLVATIATGLICSLGNRLRGGLWGDRIGWGATTARIVAWAVPVAILSGLWYGLVWYLWIAMGVAAWLGTIAGWWGRSIDMGRREGTWAHDMMWITLRGAAWTLPCAAVLAYAGFWPGAALVFVSGALMGVWYEIGWRTPSTIPGLNQGPEVGEAVFGLMFGLCLALGAWVF